MGKIKLGFASDHRGFKLKEELIKHFNDYYEIIDCGTNSSDSCDYPDYAYKLGELINTKKVDFGIGICGSGIGISIALNKINGIYCAKVSNCKEAEYTRLDNNANCLALSEQTDFLTAIKIIETFVNTEFSYLEKHERRIDKVKKIENGEYHA